MKITSLLLAFVGIISSAAAEKKPNILFIITDDQGYGDLACHGHPFLKTPNLDKLHSESTRFTDYHVSPTCAPTRAALMSGKNPFEVGVTHTILERERLALNVTTVADILKEAGYETGIFGKWHLGEEDAYQPGSRGFDEVFIHGAGGIGQNFAGSQGDVPGNDYFDPTILHNGIFEKTSGFCTDVFVREALGWMHEKRDKPFFAYIALNAPHGPFHAPEKYKEMYREYTKGDENAAGFFGMITNIDDNVGLVMEKLEEWDIADDTLLIFMTDNGTAKGSKYFNAGMKGAKVSVNQGGARVPFFMRLPGLTKPGYDIDKLARHIDVFPTFAELAGADISELGLEGRSLLPLIKDPEAAWPDRKLFFHSGRWPKEGAPGQFGKGSPDPDKYKDKKFAVRTDRWRLVSGELYDIDKDPGEQNDVSKQHPEVVQELRKAWDDYWQHARPLMINEDASLDVEKPFEKKYLEQKESTGIPAWNPSDI
ncbi:MAG: arylsulfatase [Akkermansiaceae bacterium]|jgi:arylsulfatase A-like enzyme|nr:arylsulfatase [Akkermansiaceae bacterium]MDP4898926.1 arylsulfatase [Akkermansiaceae bacterium]MDP4997130.1 arylsulfatase [Akkermansiaceae bacterium]